MAKKSPQLSSILKNLLFQKDMKPIDLARETGVPQQTIQRWVSGSSTRPYKDSLKPIAQYFSLTEEQLLGKEPIASLWAPEKEASFTTMLADFKTAPLLEWAEAMDAATAKVPAKHLLPIMGNISHEAFAVLMPDHSMDPVFPKDSVLIFDPQKKAVDRSYVLVKLDGCATPTFRQLLIDAEDSYLKPLNPDLSAYKIRFLTEKDKIIATLFESRAHHSMELT